VPVVWHWYEVIAWIANLALVGAGIYGVIIALRTLDKIERQTKAAQDAASAAKLSAYAVIRSERPWIVITVESPRTNEFTFRATNAGRTPANIVAMWAGELRVDRDEVLNLPEGYYNEEHLFGSFTGLLPSTATCTIGSYSIETLRRLDSTEMWINSIANSISTVYFWGRISYRDVFNVEPIAHHETKWLYILLPVAQSLPIADPRGLEFNTYNDRRVV
jgi:hypothetical protein